MGNTNSSTVVICILAAELPKGLQPHRFSFQLGSNHSISDIGIRIGSNMTFQVKSLLWQQIATKRQYMAGQVLPIATNSVLNF